MTRELDCWAQWIASLRLPPGEPEHTLRAGPAQWRDRVLARAGRLDETTTLLDVGCGEGLIGFGALELGAGTVIFSDISQDLLDFCEAKAAELDLRPRSRFVRVSAQDLTPIADESVDVVTTRSVLIYVADKSAAFHEFARVLRPGGRVSLFEPINRFARTGADTWAGYDLSEVPDLAPKIRAVYEAIQPPDSDPMLDFDERDLVRLAEDAGFFPIQLQLEGEIRATDAMGWDEFVSRAGNPRIPTLAEAMEHALTLEEQERLTAHLGPLVEAGRGVWRLALAYLAAAKPESTGDTGSPRRGSSVGRAHG